MQTISSKIHPPPSPPPMANHHIIYFNELFSSSEQMNIDEQYETGVSDSLSVETDEPIPRYNVQFERE